MLNSKNSILIMIDVQDKLVKMLNEKNQNEMVEKTKKIVSAAKILHIDTITTEQYPKGLGATIQEVQEILGEKYLPFEKTNFSIVKEDEIFEAVKKTGKKQVVLFGIEAHICVFQTAIELKEMGYEVFVVYDISHSRKDEEKLLAMKNLSQLGILTLSLEMVLFMWLTGSKNPNFKEVQALIK